MNTPAQFRSFHFARTNLLLGLLFTPFVVRATLPPKGFPLGRPDLVETRTIKELRPGLTHVHVERGAWPNEGPPKTTLTSAPQQDKTLLAPVRSCLEKAGYTVHEHQLYRTADAAPYYILFAGEFEGGEEARQALRELPCATDLWIGNPAYFRDWDTGPWVLDIVIVDPEVYHGKVVSAWSGKAWRESPLELARKHNAVVATNGSFFEYSDDGINGVPTGISISQGQWHHEPQAPEQRAPMLFIENTASGPRLSIGSNADAPPFPEFKWTGKGIGGSAGAKSIKLDGIDRMPRDNELVVMRERVVATSPLSHFIPPHILLMQIGKDGYLAPGVIPNDGLVLMATGSKQGILQEAVAAKKPVELDLSVPGRPGLNAFYVTPTLVKNGQPTPRDWGASPSPNSQRRMARTAIGADAGGKIYLISVDGSGAYLLPAGSPVGANMDELREVAQFLGLTNAANLDGGGSSTSMVIEGKTMGYDTAFHMTTPYDDDRRVGDAVLIIDDE